MKLVVCDGRSLTVRDVGPVLLELRARSGGPPLKLYVRSVVEDAEARALVRAQLDLGLYDRVVG